MQLKPALRKATELGVGLTAIATLILAGCGGGGGGTSASGSTATTTANITPFKGPFYSGASVSLKDANGDPVSLISGGTINASGVASVTYNANAAYPLIVEVRGDYYNENTGTVETTVIPIRGLIENAGAASNVPVTVVTETAVADLEKRLGSFAAAHPIQAASAVAALRAAGAALGVPASAIPAFDPTTRQISDPDTLRLAAWAVVADSHTGATLAEKVKALANTLVANPASAPSAVVSQAAYNNALTAMTAGASSVLAAGATPPAPPAIPTSSYDTLYAYGTMGAGVPVPVAAPPQTADFIAALRNSDFVSAEDMANRHPSAESSQVWHALILYRKGDVVTAENVFDTVSATTTDYGLPKLIGETYFDESLAPVTVPAQLSGQHLKTKGMAYLQRANDLYFSANPFVQTLSFVPPLKGNFIVAQGPMGGRAYHSGFSSFYSFDLFYAGAPQNNSLGLPFYAIADGVVTFVEQSHPDNPLNTPLDPAMLSKANLIVVRHAGGIESSYAHMQQNTAKVAVGDFVTSGQVLGAVGNSGYSTGPHVHFHVNRIGDPVNLPVRFTSLYTVDLNGIVTPTDDMSVSSFPFFDYAVPPLNVTLFPAAGDAAATYVATGAGATDMLAYANYRRAQVGLPPLATDPQLARAAQNHAQYLASNVLCSGSETAGTPGFTGIDAMTRVNTLFPASGIYEADSCYYGSNLNTVITLPTGDALIRNLFDSPLWLREAILSNSAMLGAGFAQNATAAVNGITYGYAAATLDFANSTPPMADSQLLAYPFNGQTGVAASWSADQAYGAIVAWQNVGYPITLQAASAGAVMNLTSFTLTDSVGNNVPLTSLDHSVQPYLRGAVIGIPNAPLAAATTYTVRVQGVLVPPGGVASPFNLSWSFTTR